MNFWFGFVSGVATTSVALIVAVVVAHVFQRRRHNKAVDRIIAKVAAEGKPVYKQSTSLNGSKQKAAKDVH